MEPPKEFTPLDHLSDFDLRLTSEGLDAVLFDFLDTDPARKANAHKILSRQLKDGILQAMVEKAPPNREGNNIRTMAQSAIDLLTPKPPPKSGG